MKLKDYLKKNDRTLKSFCLQNDFVYGYLRHISNKRKRPSPEMALRIEKATKGKVTRMELLYPR